jgi:tetraacyldisaccharide 4'-kinase
MSWLFCALVSLRRWVYRKGIVRIVRMPVPVVVVGNVSVGGTGKTPLVLWVVELLKAHGLAPGIVSRGYGGRAINWPQILGPDSDAHRVGDEAVLMFRRCGCPVAVAPDRVAAARVLLERTSCGVIVADDGLQHYALGRDLEIAVLDGARRFGNGHCLPAGPLRESPRRLRSVDLVVANGRAAVGEHPMQIEAGQAVHLSDGERRPLAAFRTQEVHAVAGVGNPERFFGLLRTHGLRVIEHPFPDHHAYRPRDIRFGAGKAVLMTEKDAVKCTPFARTEHWSVPIRASLDPELGRRILSRIKEPA